MCMEYKRGDMIWIKDSNKKIGCEQKGERPAIVIQNNLGNKHSPNLIVAKMTSKKINSKLPTHVIVEGYYKKSVVMCEMLETISKERVDNTRNKITLKQQDIELLDAALRISLAL